MDNVLNNEMFKEVGIAVANHPFLQAMKNGKISYEQWRDYVMARLSTGDDFVLFLTQIEHTTRSAGFEDLADAIARNIDEELGIYDGKEDISRTHSEWRKWCREGVMEILSRAGVSLDTPQSNATTKYREALTELLKTYDPIIQSGALVALEEIIACEYERVLEGVAVQLPDLKLDTKAMTYFRSHAIHDHRHFLELFGPLQAICDTPDKVNRAIVGLVRMQKAKMKFLDTMV